MRRVGTLVILPTQAELAGTACASAGRRFLRVECVLYVIPPGSRKVPARPGDGANTMVGRSFSLERIPFLQSHISSRRTGGHFAGVCANIAAPVEGTRRCG
jgi:hypothetical protein